MAASYPSKLVERVRFSSAPRMKHFHVYMGGGQHVFSDGRYAEPAKSIEDFMALCSGILGDNVGSEPVMTETAMNHLAAEDINKAVFVDAGEIRIIWTVCDGEICFKPVLN